MGAGPSPIGPSGLIPPYVSGITAPQHGMPSCGTPFGIPGPPHVPFGGPAGVVKHSMKRHTRMHIPESPRNIGIHLRERPGYSVPHMPNRARITEQMIQPSLPFNQPHILRHESVNANSCY